MDERGERVKEYFEIFCMVGETCGFAQENEGKLGGFRRWKDWKKGDCGRECKAQSSQHDESAMGKSEGGISQRKGMEGYRRRFERADAYSTQSCLSGRYHKSEGANANGLQRE
jgi:hypothetical protein